jgi:Mrp family chromosome partitioning ATPase
MSLPLKHYEPDLEIATPRSPTGRNFSELAHVLVGSLGGGSHVISVIGASAGDGSGLVAANLAAALSRSQADVTLICADLEESVIPGMFGLPPGPGLTDILTRNVPASAVGNRLARTPRLELILPGSAAGQQAEELRLDALGQLLDKLRGDARWIIVESPPVASGPDAYTIAQAADATVLVAEIPAARTDQVLDTSQHLERTGATVLGVVLLRSPKARAGTSAPSVTEPAHTPVKFDTRPPVHTSGDMNDETVVFARTDLPARSEEASEEAPSSVRGS